MRFFSTEVEFSDVTSQELKQFENDYRTMNDRYWKKHSKFSCATMVNKIEETSLEFLFVYWGSDMYTCVYRNISEIIDDYIESLESLVKFKFGSYTIGTLGYCTENAFYEILNLEDRNSYATYIYRANISAFESLGLENQAFLIKEDLVFYDKVIPSSNKYLKQKDLEHIRSNNNSKSFLNPVNYIIESDDTEERAFMEKDLIATLYMKGIIYNERVIRMYSSRSYIIPATGIDNIDTLDGGLIIIDTVLNPLKKIEYFEKFAEEKQEKDKNLINILSAIYSEQDLLKNQFIVIVLAKKYDTITKEILKKYCPNWPFHTLHALKRNYADARKRLEKKASKYGVEKEISILKKRILKDGEYSEKELDAIFNRWYRNEYLIEKEFPSYKEIIDSYYDDETISAEEELSQLIGLDKVKKTVLQLKDYCILEKYKRKKGLKTNPLSLHMVFFGNPGTAKTTVARIMAKIFKEIGVLEKGELVECSRADLVGKYVGWTANMVRQKFEEAKGSVLFIDEAYSLDVGGEKDFGKEAINSIVQEMENNRNDVIVIMAGYKGNMFKLLNVNPGLKSRINYSIEFPDYSDEELYKILLKMAKDNGVELDKEVKGFFMKNLESEYLEGNGRFVRNIFEKALINQSVRLMKMNKKERDKNLKILNKEDFVIC